MTCKCPKERPEPQSSDPREQRDPPREESLAQDHSQKVFNWTGLEGFLWSNEWYRDQRGPMVVTLSAAEWTRPSPSEMKEAFGATKVGKKLPDSLYLHVTATDTLPALLYRQLERALSLAGDIEYDIVKIGLNGLVSLLSYPDFMEDPHPALEAATIVNLEKGTVREQDYQQRQNPPILHRKETFLDADHPRASEFRKLTQQEQQRGLLNEPNIGTRGRWEDLLAQKGLAIEDHRIRQARVKGKSMTKQLQYRGRLYRQVQAKRFHYRGYSYREAGITAQEAAEKIKDWWERRGEEDPPWTLEATSQWKRKWDARKALLEFLEVQPEPDIGDRVMAYRCTYRKEEPQDVRQGVEIISKNHATGEIEKGMSVSMGLDYAGTTDLKWVYKVEGTVIDFGSDGEPILTNVKVVGPIISTNEAVWQDQKTGTAAQEKKRRRELSRLTGVDPHKLIDLQFWQYRC